MMYYWNAFQLAYKWEFWTYHYVASDGSDDPEHTQSLQTFQYK